MRLEPADVERVADVITEQAATAADPAAYLRDLIWRADLPPQWRGQVIALGNGNIAVGTRTLVRWAAGKGTNPRDPRYTTLGSLLAPLLDDVGPDVAADLVAVIVSYGLFRGGEPFTGLLARFQVPTAAAPADGNTFAVPDVPSTAFDRMASAELQRRPPAMPLLDVGFLAEGIRRSAAVCRVELDGAGDAALGTGFLVGSGTAVTARHVLDEAHGRPVRLRFRCTTASAGTVVALDPARPVAASSPVDELDFALLRLAKPEDLPDGVTPLRLDSASAPRGGDTVAILQHPDGAPMRLAVSANAVTRVDPRRRTILYNATTSGGSSGAPCFDEGWRPVAVHRAERATFFGAVREGVLLSAIHETIHHLLS